MSLALYMDEHVHRAVTNGLLLRDVDVLTVQEDGRTGFPDPLVLDRASELGRVLFTQDDDLLGEANRRQQAGIDFPGVIYAHQLLVSIGDCVTIFYKRDRFRVALNIRNLFNVDYFEAVFTDLRVYPGDPFTVQGTVSWQF